MVTLLLKPITSLCQTNTIADPQGICRICLVDDERDYHYYTVLHGWDYQNYMAGIIKGWTNELTCRTTRIQLYIYINVDQCTNKQIY